MPLQVIQTEFDVRLSGKRILFVPDSIWGDLSGHRSSKHLTKAFKQLGLTVGVYAPMENFSQDLP